MPASPFLLLFTLTTEAGNSFEVLVTGTRLQRATSKKITVLMLIVVRASLSHNEDGTADSGIQLNGDGRNEKRYKNFTSMNTTDLLLEVDIDGWIILNLIFQ
jgi:hypothetical protein